MNAEVRNNPAEYRYEVWADGQLAGFSQYVRRPERIAFLHTEIHKPYEGLGLGGRLVREVLDDACQGPSGNALLPLHRSLHRAPHRSVWRTCGPRDAIRREIMSQNPPLDSEAEKE